MSTDTKFTPGPWSYSVAPCGYIYAITQPANDCIRVETNKEANAHLIAAAPDMYEALGRLLSAYAFIKPPGYPLSDAEKMARAALAKARGEGSHQ